MDNLYILDANAVEQINEDTNHTILDTIAGGGIADSSRSEPINEYIWSFYYSSFWLQTTSSGVTASFQSNSEGRWILSTKFEYRFN